MKASTSAALWDKHAADWRDLQEWERAAWCREWAAFWRLGFWRRTFLFLMQDTPSLVAPAVQRRWEDA